MASNVPANVSRKRLSLDQVSQHLDLSDSGVFEEDDSDRESNYKQLDFEPDSEDETGNIDDQDMPADYEPILIRGLYPRGEMERGLQV